MRRRAAGGRAGTVGTGLGLALLLVAGPGAAPATAQTDGGGDLTVGGGPVFELYSFSDAQNVGIESLSLFTLPVAGRATVAPGLDVRLFGNLARGALSRPDGTETTLTGLTDTDLQVDYRLADGALTLTGIVSLPTGASTHDSEEIQVAGAVASDLLPFRISNWGTGGYVAVQAAAARRFEGFGAGLSVSYRAAREFEPVEGGQTYAPGDELQVQLALDTEMGGGKGSLLVGFRNYSDDALGGTNAFQPGVRVNVTGSYAFPLGFRGAGVVYGGVLHRENGTSIRPVFTDSPSQDLVLLGGHLRTPWGGTWIRPRADLRVFRSEDGVGQGYVAGVGGSVELAGDPVTWVPTVTARFGSVEVTEGSESTFTGLEVGVSARFSR